MKNYYILDGQQESGPYTLEMLKKQGLAPGTLIRLYNSTCWVHAEKIEDLSAFIFPANASTEGMQMRNGKNQSNKFAFAIKATRLLVPLLIGLGIASITISMGAIMQGKTFSNPGKPVTLNNTPAKVIRKQKPSPQIIAAKHQDVIAALGTEPAKDYAPVSPGIHQDAAGPVERLNYYKKNWSKFIKITSSEYKHRLLGGIRGLAIIFTNNTDYAIDNVVAKITYIKGNGKTWKTKWISLSNIAPHSEKDQKIDNVSRSRSVKVNIQKITSSSLDLYFDKEKEGPNSHGPFYSRH